MSDVTLERLRQLRRRATLLLRHIERDLRPFKKDDGTFRRRPDSHSPPGDLNVTTTCSCLMALAHTNQFRSFYSNAAGTLKPQQEARRILLALMKAPWMSSGLTDNNAFTTSLVLRAFGFLTQERLFGEPPPCPSTTDGGLGRTWDVQFGINDVRSLAHKLLARDDSASEFLWASLSDDTRVLLNAATADDDRRVKAALALDLARAVQAGWIYDEARFPKASNETKAKLEGRPTGYELAVLNRQLLADQYSDELSQPVPRSFTEIASLIAEHEDHFSINQYPPSAAVVYWFVDGVTRAGITLRPEHWDVIYRFAAREFNHRRSLVVAEHAALMDPIAMGMSACLCARLRALSDRSGSPRAHDHRGITGTSGLGTTKHHRSVLPSVVELERSIQELILKQTPSGIWHKYFPLFHYQDAGSNFCFTFELLEATLTEFGHSNCPLLTNDCFVRAMEIAVDWCASNQLEYSEQGVTYTGWNSGGQLVTLEKGQPESWATAVVHMFLSELAWALSERIQSLILQKYNTRNPTEPVASEDPTRSEPASALAGLLDIEILLRGTPEKLSTVLRSRIIDSYRAESPSSLRRRAQKKPRSALLFGPPGTSKTEITRAIAEDLSWPLVEITPSDFVKGNLANVYLNADEIFKDLMDLSGVVVFFDEMDALVQTREGDVRLDMASQFLTTMMLPKLTQLHDQARVVFLMATNFQDRFDAAIKRAGRFDLLLCMGPPQLSQKLDRVDRVVKTSRDQAIKAGRLMKRYLNQSPELKNELSLYTFGEYKAFLRTIGDEESIGDAVEKLGAVEFRKQLRAYSKFVTLKVAELAALRKVGVKWTRLVELDKKSFSLRQLEGKKLPITHIVRYYVDRKESKEQY